MARRRRRRHYGEITSVNLGAVTDILRSHVSAQDVLVGVAAGFVGANLVKLAAKKFIPATQMAQLEAGAAGKALPLLSAAGAAAALYMLQKRTAPARAEGHAVGALAAGLTLSVAAYLSTVKIPGTDATFSEVTSVNLGYHGYNYGGLLVSDTTDGLSGYGGYNGLLVSDTTDGSLSGLAMAAMGDDDDGLGSLMEM